MSCGVKPRARARAWSTLSLNEGIFSPQLRCGSISRGSARMTSRTRVAASRTDVGLWSDNAKLNGKSDRRAEIEAIEPDPRRAGGALGDGGLDARDDDDLGERFIRLDRLEPEPEPGRALADV